MEYEVIVDNAQVLVAPGKKKLSPGLPLGIKFTAKSFQGGGVFFDPDGRYPYTEVWTDLDNVQVVAESPPPSEGVPDPVPAGAYQTVYNGETYANRDEIVWVKI